MANVEIQWDFDRDVKKYRFESFVMVQYHVNIIRWAELAQFHIKNKDSALDDGYLYELCTDGRDYDD